MIKNKSNSMPSSLNDWQPDTSQMPAGYVMPYTQGGPNPTDAQAATSLDPVHFLPGNEVPGNTDTGVTHSSGSLDLNPSKGS